MGNRIHIEISPENDQAILGSSIPRKLSWSPMLKTISTDDRRTLPNWDKQRFVRRQGTEYSKSDSQFNPPFMNPQDLEVDFTSVTRIIHERLALPGTSDRFLKIIRQMMQTRIAQIPAMTKTINPDRSY